MAPLVQRLSGINRVIPIALRRWKKNWFSSKTQQERRNFKQALQQSVYDIVADCQGLIKSACVARLARLTPEGLRGSFANSSQACSYEWPVKFLLPNNQPMPDRIHAIARSRLLVSKLLGYEVQGLPKVALQVKASSFSAANAILLTHGTTRPDNEWPLSNWEQLIRLLTEHHQCRFLLPHSNAHELAFCFAIERCYPNNVEILPCMALTQLLDVMARCQGVIGVDSGLSHLAVALDLPHVQIFSQDRAWRAGPTNTPHQLAVGGLHRPSVQDVYAAWLKVKPIQ